jgi:acetyltransferase-like isoleucine patch superfamily enzyme
VQIQNFVNLYGCEIGDETRIGPFVQIQKGARIGERCKISSHSFICEEITIESEVFVGHGVTFVNDRFPRAATESGMLKTDSDWSCECTLVCKGVAIGSGAKILSGVTIGAGALVGARRIVTKDVPPRGIVAGNPAAVLRETA